jgi:hypothetical protein
LRFETGGLHAEALASFHPPLEIEPAQVDALR